MVLATAPAQGPELVKEKGRRDDRGPAIESETVALVDIGSSARRIELFQNRDPPAACCQPDGRCQPAEAAANNDRMGLFRPAF